MANVRCGSVRGHLTNKSTAFSPDGTGYGKQSMIHEHMMSHYRLVENAKPSIDNKPPKSIGKHIKAHIKRVNKSREIERKTHRDELRSRTSTPFEKNNCGIPFLKSSTSIGFHYDEKFDDTHFLDSQRRTREFENQYQQNNKLESFSKTRSSFPVSYKTSPNIQIKCQVTPKYKIEMYEPETKPVEIKGSLFQSSSRSLLKNNNFDADSILFLNSSKHYGKPKTSYIDSDVWSNGIVSYKQPNYTSSLRLDFSTMSLNEQLNHARTTDKFENKTLPLYESKRLQKQEELIAEEQMYLQFMEELTTDVLTRGIFSDRVLNQVFDVHIERMKGYLNEGRMRAMIEELKRDLNVKNNSTSVRQSVSSSSFKMCGSSNSRKETKSYRKSVDVKKASNSLEAPVIEAPAGIEDTENFTISTCQLPDNTSTGTSDNAYTGRIENTDAVKASSSLDVDEAVDKDEAINEKMNDNVIM